MFGYPPEEWRAHCPDSYLPLDLYLQPLRRLGISGFYLSNPHSMADWLKLFLDKRLTPSEPHHLEHIKGRLAAMKVEDPKAYLEYSAHYGVGVDVVDVPAEAPVAEEPKKKRGRPAKVVEPAVPPAEVAIS